MLKIKIFVSYSHQNEDWVLKEGKFKLIPWLERQLEGQAEIWTDHALKRMIGEEYTILINEKISAADIALLLISQDFVSSQYIMDVELPLIQQKYKNHKIKILPLLITDLTKKGKEKISWIFDLQTYPNDTKPLIDFANNNADWERVKVEILEGVETKIDEQYKFLTRQIIITEDKETDKVHLKVVAIDNNKTVPIFQHKISVQNYILKAILMVLGILVLLSIGFFIINNITKNNHSIRNSKKVSVVNDTLKNTIEFFDDDLLFKSNEKRHKKADYLKIAYTSYLNGEYDKAIEAYEKVIDISYDYADAYFGLSNSYAKIGNYKKSNAYHNTAIYYQKQNNAPPQYVSE